jgi:hypothetical protein
MGLLVQKVAGKQDLEQAEEQVITLPNELCIRDLTSPPYHADPVVLNSEGDLRAEEI